MCRVGGLAAGFSYNVRCAVRVNAGHYCHKRPFNDVVIPVILYNSADGHLSSRGVNVVICDVMGVFGWCWVGGAPMVVDDADGVPCSSALLESLELGIGVV